MRAHDFTQWSKPSQSVGRSSQEIVNISTPNDSPFKRKTPQKRTPQKKTPVKKESQKKSTSPLQIFNQLYKENKHLMSKEEDDTPKSFGYQHQSQKSLNKRGRVVQKKPKRKIIKMKQRKSPTKLEVRENLSKKQSPTILEKELEEIREHQDQESSIDSGVKIQNSNDELPDSFRKA